MIFCKQIVSEKGVVLKWIMYVGIIPISYVRLVRVIVCICLVLPNNVLDSFPKVEQVFF